MPPLDCVSAARHVSLVRGSAGEGGGVGVGVSCQPFLRIITQDLHLYYR